MCPPRGTIKFGFDLQPDRPSTEHVVRADLPAAIRILGAQDCVNDRDEKTQRLTLARTGGHNITAALIGGGKGLGLDGYRG